MIEFDESFIEAMERLTYPVGLRGNRSAEPVSGREAPAGATEWRNSYAVLLVVPVPSEKPDVLERRAADGKAWLFESLVAEEKRGKLLDGYLVLALDAEPSTEVHQLADELAADSSVCRKHVIWRANEQTWDEALWQVTVLGLPPIVGADLSGPPIPALPREAKRALALYAQLKSYEAVAESLLGATKAARRREV